MYFQKSIGPNDYEKAAFLHKIFTVITYISGVLYYLSTCINPLLYNIMSNKFRKAFKVINYIKVSNFLWFFLSCTWIFYVVKCHRNILRNLKIKIKKKNKGVDWWTMHQDTKSTSFCHSNDTLPPKSESCISNIHEIDYKNSVQFFDLVVKRSVQKGRPQKIDAI